MTETPVLHLTGPVLTGPTKAAPEAWVVDGRITYRRPLGLPDVATQPGQESASSVKLQVIVGFVLPGLVDVHSHIGLGESGAVSDEAARAQALADRDAGVLLIRDAGSPAQTRWMDDAVDLPRIVRCGRHVARPRRYLRYLAREIEPVDLVRVLCEEAAAGDGWVKLVGDWIDRDRTVPDLTPLWPPEVLARAVAAVHALGARVTTHVFSQMAAAQALAAGVDCLEHGCGLDAELMKQAVDQGVRVVPTMLQRANFASIGAAGRVSFPVWAARFEQMYTQRCSQARALFEAGVPLLLGSDQGTTIPHGSLPREAAALVEAGIPAADVVAAATWAARAYLGFDSLTEGAPADLVVYPADPRRDISVLACPKVVILRGHRVTGLK